VAQDFCHKEATWWFDPLKSSGMNHQDWDMALFIASSCLLNLLGRWKMVSSQNLK
jgi:hypothetical protein